MLSHQVIQNTQKILDSISEKEIFIKTINDIQESYKHIVIFLFSGPFENPSKYESAKGTINGKLTNLTNTLRTINIRLFYMSLEHVSNTLDQAHSDNNFRIISDIKVCIQNFDKSYQNYIETKTQSNTIKMICLANDLVIMLKSFKNSILFYNTNLIENSSIQKNQAELSIQLSSKMSFSQFSRKIVTIEKMYEETCLLLEISTTDFPLLIQKIESGSLFSKVVGHTAVIGLIVTFLQSSAGYLYRNYTDEGKVEAIPKKIEALNKMLDFSNKLKKAGVKTKDIEDTLKKSGVTLSNQINDLLDGEPKVIINDKKYSLRDETQKRFDEGKLVLRIEHKLDIQEED
jgi:hypothetical protein